MNDLGSEVEQVVLAFDESGVATWNFPVPQSPPGKKRFLIRAPTQLPPASDPSQVQKRALIRWAGKLLKTFIYRVTDPVVGVISDKAAGLWEGKNRPYGLRTFTPDNAREANVPELSSGDFRKLAEGPALLLIHGTFSTARACFAEFPSGVLKTLFERYDGRVFAFNHYTLSHDPIENASWFLEHLPSDVALDLDILAHSRGGLVARTLAGEHPDLTVGGDRVRVRKVVFAGVPNRGTILCQPAHIPHLLDRYTTALNLLPTGPIGEILDAVVTVVKVIGHGILTGLSGLGAMDPGGRFLSRLSTGNGGNTVFYGLASDYEPTDQGFISFLKDGVMDRVFGDERNDLVVPTAGVEPQDQRIVAANLVTYPANEGVHHSGYFGEPETQTRLLSWLA